jgi:hypothetical protein
MIAVTKEYAAKWRAANRERINKRAREWRATNKERDKEYAAKWRKNNRDRAMQKSNKWRKANPEKVKTIARKGALKRYGLLSAEFDTMLATQNSRCAICKTNNPRGKGQWAVDHCKYTYAVRGLLCIGCNLGLGLFKHDPNLLQQASNYLLNAPTPTLRRDHGETSSQLGLPES